MEPLPKNHEFTHPELAYDAEANFQPAIKISVFFRKLDRISDEDFFRHWETVHADLAVATKAFQTHILRYVQVRMNTSRRSSTARTDEVGSIIKPPK